MHIDLTPSIAIVTGASKGIGRAIAVMLAGSGAKVALNYLGSGAETEAAVEEIRAAGGTAKAFQADVTQADQVKRLVREVAQAFGGHADIVINNAGHLVERCPNAEMTEELYDKIMDVNMRSTMLMCREVISPMKEMRRGKIVNMSSLAAHNAGGPGASIYAASKAAVLTYTKGLAKEMAPYGIRVNAISPGFIGQTDFHATFTPDEARKAIVAGIPLGREGTPQDVAGAALFLVSELSAYLTGETIEVNGGMNMR